MTGKSGNDRINRVSIVDFQTFAAGNFQATRFDPQLLHNRRVNVGDVVTILNGVEAKFVGGSMDGTAFDATAGHPDREAEVVVASPVRTLTAWRASELRTPDHKRLVKESSLFEILQQRRDGLVDLLTIYGMVGLQVAVSVPGPCSAATVINLHEADPPLD